MASKSGTLDLTRLDLTMIRMYVRHLLVFPFSDVSKKEEAQASLATALLATLKEFPFLAGTIERTNHSTGAMTVRYPDSISMEDVSRMLTVSSLDVDELSYSSLREAGIPPSGLHNKAFCPSTLRAHAGLDDPFAEGLTTFAKGLPIPVFAAQLNFIPGGLILSVYAHHSVVDGTGIAKIYQQWSTHTRNYSHEMRIPDQVEAVSLNSARHALDSLILDAPTMDLPEFRYPGDPINPTLRDIPYKLSAKILVFPAATVLQLADTLSAISTKHISTFTALTALIWCQVTDARRDAMAEKGIKETSVGIVIDHRKRLGSLLPDNYVGNCANGMTVSLPLSTIPSGKTLNDRQLAPIAVAIRDGLADVDIDWFRARLLALSKQENSSKLMLNLDTRNGHDVFISSWTHMGADDVWGIPGTAEVNDEEGTAERWECRPTAIRKPQCATESAMLILPRRRGVTAPFEILICLEQVEMEKVSECLLQGKWITRIVDG